MNRPVQVNKDDVVSMDAAQSLIGLETFKISQLAKGLKERWGTEAIEKWLLEGIACEVLKANGGGWQRGKIRFQIAFVPEQENESMPVRSGALPRQVLPEVTN